MTSCTTKGIKNEQDPHGKNIKEPGAKVDAGKAPIYRGVLSYFPRAVAAVAEVSSFGAGKYTWGGWRTVPDGINRYTDAMVRHVTTEGSGEDVDSDSGLLHATHAAWNALARLELILQELEDRKIWGEGPEGDDIIEFCKNHWSLRGDEPQPDREITDPHPAQYMFGEFFEKGGC